MQRILNKPPESSLKYRELERYDHGTSWYTAWYIMVHGTWHCIYTLIPALIFGCSRMNVLYMTFYLHDILSIFGMRTKLRWLFYQACTYDVGALQNSIKDACAQFAPHVVPVQVEPRLQNPPSNHVVV